MSAPTDNQVWIAFDAGKREAGLWQIIAPSRGFMAIAIRDGIDGQTPTPLEGPISTTGAVERFDFNTELDAKEYVQWRTIKAALSAYEKTRS